MPRANPKASFDVAVRHLFRHLDEPDALRSNPLVGHFFSGSSDARFARQRDRMTAERIRELIRSIAQRCFDEDSEAGKRQRGLLQFVIVTECFLERRSIEDVARELSISQTELYRRRAEVCRRIATRLKAQDVPADAAASAIFDVRQFQIDRAERRTEIGEYDHAIRDYTELIEDNTDPCETIEALCKRADVELEAARSSQAHQSLTDARQLLEMSGSRFSASTLARLHSELDFIESKRLWTIGELLYAVETLQSARRRLTYLASPSDVRVKELHFDILLRLGEYAECYGNFSEATKMLIAADDIRKDIPNLSAQRQIDHIDARMVVECSTGAAFVLDDQIRLLSSAMELAKTCASVKRIVETQASLAYTLIGNDRHTTLLDAAKQIVSMARKVEGPRLATSVSIRLADYLSGDDMWASVPSILGEAQRHVCEGSIAWCSLNITLAGYHLRNRQALESRRCARAVYLRAMTMQNQRWIAASLRKLAASSQALGRKDEALEYITAALPIAERHASAMACTRTYESAAVITGRKQYAKVALERRRLLL